MGSEQTEYLGDGVYATMDAWGDITLDLRAQDSTTRIVLEPEVFSALKMFASKGAKDE